VQQPGSCLNARGGREDHPIRSSRNWGMWSAACMSACKGAAVCPGVLLEEAIFLQETTGTHHVNWHISMARSVRRYWSRCERPRPQRLRVLPPLAPALAARWFRAPRAAAGTSNIERLCARVQDALPSMREDSLVQLRTLPPLRGSAAGCGQLSEATMTSTPRPRSRAGWPARRRG